MTALPGLRVALTLPVHGEHNRFLNVLPQPDGLCYVGLTDEPVDGDLPDVPEPSEAEIDFLVSTVSSNLAHPLTRADVVGAYAGLRPLLRAGGRTSDLSRRHAVLTSPSGVVTVVGGKLTTYRRMAQDAVDAAVAHAALEAAPCRTARLPLTGAAPRAELARLAATAVSPRLVRRYGADAALVLDTARETSAMTDDELLAPVADGVPVTLAELLFGVAREGAYDVADLLDRRTRVGLVGADRELAVAAASYRARDRPPQSSLNRHSHPLNHRSPLPVRVELAYCSAMLEPRGAASSTSVEPATDVSARVRMQARNALLQGRIADAIELADRARHDDDLDDAARAQVALTGLLARLARGDVRGAAPYSRELTTLTRVHGRVAAHRLLRARRVRLGARPDRPGGRLLRAGGRGARRRRGPFLAAVAQRARPAHRRSRRDRDRGRAGRGGAGRGAGRALVVRRCLHAAHPRGHRAHRRPSAAARRGTLDAARQRIRPARGADPDRPRRVAAAPAARGVGSRRRPPARCREVRPPGGPEPAARPHPVAARAARRGSRRRAPRDGWPS